MIKISCNYHSFQHKLYTYENTFSILVHFRRRNILQYIHINHFSFICYLPSYKLSIYSFQNCHKSNKNYDKLNKINHFKFKYILFNKNINFDLNIYSIHLCNPNIHFIFIHYTYCKFHGKVCINLRSLQIHCYINTFHFKVIYLDQSILNNYMNLVHYILNIVNHIFCIPVNFHNNLTCKDIVFIISLDQWPKFYSQNKTSYKIKLILKTYLIYWCCI